MKKLLLSVSVIGLFLVYGFFKQHESDEIRVVRPSAQNPPAETPTSSSTTPAVSDSSAPNPTASPQGKYKNGEYTGNTADAFYGNIQVKAVIKNGKIADVQFLQYPNDRIQSIQINTAAMPLLTSEAIQSQSSPVDIVSGATDSSMAFNESLTSALSQAQ